MTIPPVDDRAITCPHCFSDNRLIGSDLSRFHILSCSSCGSNIGPVSEMRDSHAESLAQDQASDTPTVA